MTNGGELVTDALPAAGGIPVEDVRELLPAAVVQGELVVRPLDDADVHRQIHGGVETGLVRLESAERHVHEATALDNPRGVERRLLGTLHVAQEPIGALESAWKCLGRALVVPVP